MSRALAGRHRLWFFSVALPMWFSQGCLYVPHLFRGAPIEFRVVDDTTGAPLSNVVVTANWQLVRLNVAHPVEASWLSSKRSAMPMVGSVSPGGDRNLFGPLRRSE